MRIVHYQSKSKAKELALSAFSKMEDSLHLEIKHLIKKYSELRDSVKDMISYNEKLLKINSA